MADAKPEDNRPASGNLDLETKIGSKTLFRCAGNA
jgi:hypothetical protein